MFSVNLFDFTIFQVPAFIYQRKFGRYFRVAKSWEEVRLEGGRKERWCEWDVMSIRKRKQRDVKSVVVKTAQVWRESKIAREILCFTIETAVGGREGRRCRTGGCGLCSLYVRSMFALSPGEPAMAGVFRGRGQDSNAWNTIGECNHRFLDALAGEFRGRGKESHVRHIIGECTCRLPDALAGGFRGRGKERCEEKSKEKVEISIEKWSFNRQVKRK